MDRVVELETSPIGSQIRFSQSLEILGYYFEIILHTQKLALSERGRKEQVAGKPKRKEQINRRETFYSENKMSNLICSKYRAAYNATALKTVVGMTMQHTSARKHN